MSVEVVTRTIQFILAPVVMVSTCAIVLGTLLSRYAFINDRLRTLAHEYRNLLLEASTAPGTPSHADPSPVSPWSRLQEIDAQIPNLVRRHSQLRNSVLVLNYAIIVFFVDMLVIAVAALENTIGWASGVSMLVFLIGVAVTAVGVFISTLEIRTSQVAVEYDISWLAQQRYDTGVQTSDLQPTVTSG